MTEHDRHDRPDAGAFINNRGEAAAETVPGGVQEDDERVAGHDRESSGEGALEERVQGRRDEWPLGHRQQDVDLTTS
ncbi:MAG TPA: hypothetical protein VFH63_02560 [candidate division Zixibacteria bacterium]|nr:hypothetical protein [candidate division Zixibacteria bacterium]